jgi:REP element-mobilizing transposase RayT
MPSRNIYKQDVEHSYYHVYARGANKQPIFLDADDYMFFISLFERYLSANPATNKAGIPYPHYGTTIELLAYCLMSNHFHALLYQIDQGAMRDLMHSLMTSYSRYFNFKYRRTGSLFESRYKASMIHDQVYLEHISRYIHLNPRYWKRYRYSSLRFYEKDDEPEWITTRRILEIFPDRKAYTNFVADYEDHKLMLDECKRQMAND